MALTEVTTAVQETGEVLLMVSFLVASSQCTALNIPPEPFSVVSVHSQLWMYDVLRVVDKVMVVPPGH